MTKKLNSKQDITLKDRPWFILLMFFPCLLINRSLDNDIWFLLNSGRYVLEHGIPYMEPFTIHQGFAFVMQQWLSACIFWVVYSKFGLIGLNLLVFICYALSVFFIYKLCMKISQNYFFISFAITLMVGVMMAPFMTQRPFIFSIVIILIAIYLLESYIISNNYKYIFFLPVLSILLINLHAAMWPMLFIMIGPYMIDLFRLKNANQSILKNKIVFFFVICVTFLLGLLNPYGIDAMTYLIKSYGYAEISYSVSEMGPPNINTVNGLIIYGSFFAIFFIYTLYRAGKTRLRYVLLSLGTAYMALSSVRSFSFFAICGVFPLAYYLKDFAFPTLKQKETTKKTLLLRKILIVLIIAAAIFGSYMTNQSNEKVNVRNTLLRNTIHFIQNEEHEGQIKLYTGYNDGGMAEFLGLPAYIDPRAEVFVKKNNKKEDIMKEYHQLQKGSLYYKDFLDKYQFTHLIVSKQDILNVNLPHDIDYQISFSNEEYTLYERRIND